MDKEIWKDIPNYEGLYQVSNYGRVKSLNRFVTSNRYKNGYPIKTRILKPRLSGKGKDKGKGYYRVVLYKNGKHAQYSIHRLVMLSFIGYSELTVNHKDENTLNNKLSNLEYLTNAENIQYTFNKKVVQYDLKGNLCKVWKSIAIAQRELKIGHISQACRGIRKSAGGYIWRYKEDLCDD